MDLAELLKDASQINGNCKNGKIDEAFALSTEMRKCKNFGKPCYLCIYLCQSQIWVEFTSTALA